MHRLLGEVAGSGDDVVSAEGAYRRALTLADELGMRPLAAHCQLGLGSLYRRTCKRPQALEHLTAATATYSELGMHWWRDNAERERNLLARPS
jgi:hypothetical protein